MAAITDQHPTSKERRPTAGGRRPLALITGATGGIGLALAREFAAHGYDLALVATSDERLSHARDVLISDMAEKNVRPQIHTLAQDLSLPGAAASVHAWTESRDLWVDVLVNNAGIGAAGETVDVSGQLEHDLLAVNVEALVDLTKAYLRDMCARGEGAILNVASTGAFSPGPYNASYYASKSFVLSYTRAVRVEAAAHGVRVCAVCPGATRTGFFAREGIPVSPGAMEPQAVARAAYRGLVRNREVTIPGIRNRLMQLAPDRLKVAVIARLKAPRD